MPYSNFPQGFAAGLSVRGVPLLQSNPGQVFWLNNSSVLNPQQRAGSDGNRGTFLDPFATLAYAVSQCVAGRGDIIMVGAGHAETVSDATTFAMNVAGVAVIGMGAGAYRPTFTFGTAATSTIPISAASMSMQNCLFVGNFLSITSAFTVPGTSLAPDFALDNCSFHDTTNVLGFLSAVSSNATANSLAGLSVTNCRFLQLGTVSPTVAITFNASQDRVTLLDNFGVSPITAVTQGPALLAAGANNVTNFNCGRNRFHRPNTSNTLPVGIATSGTAWTGMAYDNYFGSIPSGTGIWISTGSKLSFVNNYCQITGAADKSALINPSAV